jgi:hypothetical protein
VELAVGDFSDLSARLKCESFSESPGDLLASIMGDGLWQGLPWLSVTKLLYVQKILWLEEGYNMAKSPIDGIIETAKHLHAASAPQYASTAYLCDALRIIPAVQAKLRIIPHVPKTVRGTRSRLIL